MLALPIYGKGIFYNMNCNSLKGLVITPNNSRNIMTSI